MKTYRPSAKRCFLFLLLAFAGAAFFIEIDKTTPWPAIQPNEFVSWWEQLGTDQAAIVMLRIVGSGIAGWAMLVGTVGLLASFRPNGLIAGVWSIVTPQSLRRMLAVGVLTTVLAAPVAATAASPNAHAPIILEDLGVMHETQQEDFAQSSKGFATLLSDLGPSEQIIQPKQSGPTAINNDKAASRSVNAPHTSAPSEIWLVKTDDHLWKIAADTLEKRGVLADTAQVLTYWRQLIATNIDQLNNNPDLIYPGQVLTLPQVQL